MLKKSFFILMSLTTSLAMADTESTVLQRLKNLVDKNSCSKTEVMDVDALRAKLITDIIDLELQVRLRRADESIAPKTKALSRLATYQMCSQTKYGGAVNKKQNVKLFQDYKNEVLGSNFDLSPFTLPTASGTGVQVVVERGIEGRPTGWVGATYVIADDSKEPNISKDSLRITVWKNLFDILELSCDVIPLDSRTYIFAGLKKTNGFEEEFSISDRKIAEKNGYPFMVELCPTVGGRQ